MAKTIRRNAHKQLAAYADRVIAVDCYSLSNCFTATPCLEGVIKQHGSVLDFWKKEFVEHCMKRSRLTLNDAGNRICLHIHSNLWYEFDLKG